MKKIWLGLFLFSMLCINLVNAEFWEWRQEGGVDNQLSSDYSYGWDGSFYGDNYADIDYQTMNVTDYNKCTLTTSLFNPVIGDLNNDLINEIYLVVANDEIGVYDGNCEKLGEINEETIIAQPVIVGGDYSDYGRDKQIIFITKSPSYEQIISYKFDGVDFNLNWKRNLSDINFAEPNGLACNDKVCIIQQYQSGYDAHYELFDLNNLSIIDTDSLSGGNGAEYGRTGMPSFYFNVNDYTIISNSWEQSAGNGYPRIVIFEEDDIDGSGISGGFFSDHTSNSVTYSNINSIEISACEMGGHGYYLLNLKHSNSQILAIYDWDYGDLLWENKLTYPDNSSNWAVADYNSDGWNEICHLYYNNSINETWFNCYDENFDVIIHDNYTGVINNINHIALGVYAPQFYPQLGIATYEGIYYPNITNGSAGEFWSSGKTGQVDGFIVSSYSSVSGNTNTTPMLVYTDNNAGNSYIAKVSGLEYDLYCGDGSCQSYLGENIITCYEDCSPDQPPEEPEDNKTYPEEEEGSYTVGSPCKNDDDCLGNYVCQYGVCSKAGFKHECDYNYECISGICRNNKCSKPSVWQYINISKDQMFGEDSMTGNFVALAIILMTGFMFGYYAGAWFGIGAGIVLSIFFTMVGWLSAFILIGFVITGIIALFFGLMIRSAGGD